MPGVLLAEIARAGETTDETEIPRHLPEGFSPFGIGEDHDGALYNVGAGQSLRFAHRVKRCGLFIVEANGQHFHNVIRGIVSCSTVIIRPARPDDNRR